MPDHFHMLMTPPKEDGNSSLRKGSFSQQMAINEQISPARKKKGEYGSTDFGDILFEMIMITNDTSIISTTIRLNMLM